MKCPTDGTTLALSERNGIEIDYCPECRGVWLDRGELDKILERADNNGQAPQPAAQPQAMPAGYPPQAPPMGYGYSGGGHHGGGHGGQYGKRRRGGWLGELFD